MPALSRVPSAPLWIAAIVVVLFLREWRLSRQQAESLVDRVDRHLAARDREWSVLARELRDSVGRALRAAVDLRSNARVAATGAPPGADPASSIDPGGSEDLSPADAESGEPLMLPELPPRAPVDSLVRTSDVAGILADERLNPEAMDLPRVSRFRANDLLVQARTEIERLESRIALELAESLEVLRASGEFVYVAPGERAPPAGPGAWSVGESAEPEGTRMYYLYEEDHPELFEKRARIAEGGELAVRRVLALLAAEGIPGQEASGGR